jgi:glycine cleavage system transcriptional repressor
VDPPGRHYRDRVPHVAVTAFGADRPGIIAAVTGVLMAHGGNLEDTAMTQLGGHFAMMLVVAVPDGESAAALEDALAAEGAPLGLTVAVRPIVEREHDAPEGSAWAVSLYGADRPGIVHRVATALAAHGGNIVDLSTRVVGRETSPAYVLLLEVVLPPGDDGSRLGEELEALAGELGVDIHLRPDDPDVL